MSDVYILIGEIGSGKTFWGEKMAKAFDMPFFDGDTVATPEMIERVSNFKFLTSKILDNYIYNHLTPAIIEKAKENDLMVAQALYLNKHRIYLKNKLEELGHVVYFWLVDTPFFINMNQIYKRSNSFRGVIYWLLNKPFFQKPNFFYKKL